MVRSCKDGDDRRQKNLDHPVIYRDIIRHGFMCACGAVLITDEMLFYGFPMPLPRYLEKIRDEKI